MPLNLPQFSFFANPSDPDPTASSAQQNPGDVASAGNAGAMPASLDVPNDAVAAVPVVPPASAPEAGVQLSPSPAAADPATIAPASGDGLQVTPQAMPFVPAGQTTVQADSQSQDSQNLGAVPDLETTPPPQQPDSQALLTLEASPGESYTTESLAPAVSAATDVPEASTPVSPQPASPQPASPSPSASLSASTALGINGFGRIGRTAFRVWWQRFKDTVPLKVINTSGSSDLETWVHLLKYDSNYGVLPVEVSFSVKHKKDEVTEEDPELGTITIDGMTITVTAQRDPAKIPWGKYGVTNVIESTGKFVTQETASAHLQGGAAKVVVSAPPKGEGEAGAMDMTLLGVQETLPSGQVVSNASCTTNCVAPVMSIMQSSFGVEKAMLTTIHAYTDDQNLHDNSHKDMRRARAAALNIVPTSTGAARAVGGVIPEVKGKFDGLAVRVPVPVGSLSDIVFVVSREVTVEEVNAAFEQAVSTPRWKGILAVTKDPVVSHDIVGRSESAIVDLGLTQVVGGNLVKVVAWYDNEFGYCNRLVEVAVA